MPATALLHEIDQLKKVSDRLELLAEQHPLVDQALITISEHIRNSATFLEVLLVTRTETRYPSDAQLQNGLVLATSWRQVF